MPIPEPVLNINNHFALSMADNKTIRIDKFLWAVRIYKTRSIASDECRKGRIIINNIQVKPSRIISKDEIIIVKKPPVNYTFRVIEPIENRVSAKLPISLLKILHLKQKKLNLISASREVSGHRHKRYRTTNKERKKADR